MFKQKLFAPKTGLFLLIIAGLFLMNINFAEAVEWKTITDLPGLPAGRPVTLDNFIIVLYDFLLSAVGIAAMFMIVIGGFRYLTAAGNAAALSEAKDIIYSALYGLLLAISVWVIVSTINPDLVYLKEPGTTVSLEDYNCMLVGTACNTDAQGDGCKAGSSVDLDCPLVGADCNPGNGCMIGPCPTPDPDCAYKECCSGYCNSSADGKCKPVLASCKDASWFNSGSLDDNGVLKCKCLSGMIIDKGAYSDCKEACASDLEWAAANMPPCVRTSLCVGFSPDEYTSCTNSCEIDGTCFPDNSSLDGFIVEIDRIAYFKFTVTDPRKLISFPVEVIMDYGDGSDPDGDGDDGETITVNDFEHLNNLTFLHRYSTATPPGQEWGAGIVIHWNDARCSLVAPPIFSANNCMTGDYFRMRVDVPI